MFTMNVIMSVFSRFFLLISFLAVSAQLFPFTLFFSSVSCKTLLIFLFFFLPLCLLSLSYFCGNFFVNKRCYQESILAFLPKKFGTQSLVP